MSKFPNFSQNTANFPNSMGRGPIPIKRCESPGPTSWQQQHKQIGESPNLSSGTKRYSSGLYDSINNVKGLFWVDAYTCYS